MRLRYTDTFTGKKAIKQMPTIGITRRGENFRLNHYLKNGKKLRAIYWKNSRGIVKNISRTLQILPNMTGR